MSEMVHQEKMGQLDIPDDHPFFMHFHDDNTPMRHETTGELLCMMENVGGEGAATRRTRTNGNQWVHSCPKEGCRGYIKGDQTTCPICGTHVCKDCLRIVGDEPDHVCRNEDVETVAMLRQNTKPCPNCSIPIYKISGCDQMWCTQCRTPFSWRTGQKIYQRIHNPHYYEWMQRHQGEDMPRELMDIPCGGLPSVQSLRQFPRVYQEWAYTLHQQVLHFEHVVVPRYENTPFQENCKSMRVSYLMNIISRDHWRDELYRWEKASQKNQQYLQIAQTFVAVSSEWLRRMVLELPHDLDAEVKNTIGFFQYINDQIHLLNKRFHSNLSTLPYSLLHP